MLRAWLSLTGEGGVGSTTALELVVGVQGELSVASCWLSVEAGGEADPSAALRDDNASLRDDNKEGSSGSLRTRAHWWGARMVNLMPSAASRSSTLRLTAVSASHMPSGRRPKRYWKSAMPQRIWVRASRRLASGMMTWL